MRAWVRGGAVDEDFAADGRKIDEFLPKNEAYL